MPPSRRDDLIDAAMRVFYRHGFQASALDSILEEGGLSRMTLYSHFKSKDELLIAAMRRRDEIFRNRMVKFVELKSKSPRDRLLAVFDYHEQWFVGNEFCGCMFINTAAEFSDPRSAPRQVAAEHKQAIVRYLRELCEACGLDDPEGVAEQLNILLEGAIVTAQVVGKVQNGGADPGAAARVAKRMAERIIDGATGARRLPTA
jgi:AcrR family transcriptional regulator